VSFWILAAAAAAIAVVVFVIAWANLRTRNLAVQTGIQGLVGRTGIASTELAPEGIVTVDRESWTATTGGAPIHAGEKVEVIGVDGVVLDVTRQHREPSHA
jgi:membrane-bound serine protease (ClpP class)